MDRNEQVVFTASIGQLEDEQRLQKVVQGRLQQQLEQSNAVLHQQAVDMRVLEESIGVLRSQINRFGSVEESLRQMAHLVNQVQTEITELAQKTEKFERQRQLDVERLRQGAVEVWQRIEIVQKELEPIPVRLLALTDGYKRQQDSLVTIQQRVELLAQQADGFGNRAELLGEYARRLEQSIDRVEREIDPLRKQDETLGYRIQSVSDANRRIDDKIAEVLAEEQLRRDLAERIEVQKVQLQRTQQEVVVLQQTLESRDRQIEDIVKHLQVLDERRQVTNDRLSLLNEQMVAVRGESSARLAELSYVLEQQKRRLVAELEREFKELKDLKIVPAENQDG